jgi:hypothetical protein
MAALLAGMTATSAVAAGRGGFATGGRCGRRVRDESVQERRPFHWLRPLDAAIIQSVQPVYRAASAWAVGLAGKSRVDIWEWLGQLSLGPAVGLPASAGLYG